MVDTVSKKVRSHIMSRIRGKDTKPELLLRSALHRAGYRYSLKKYFPGIRCRPDITLVSKKTIIFVDGCFWHGCSRCYKPPKSNQEYWIPKIQQNVQRDQIQTKYLRTHGWRVIRIKEHELKKGSIHIDRILSTIHQSVDRRSRKP